MNKYLLFTPGPVNVAQNVRAAICRPDICHRETDFDRLLVSIEDKLLKLFEVRNANDFRAVVITGSGTAANESVLSSVVGNKNILILSNGEFGERLLNISKTHNKNTFFLPFPWGERIDASKVEAYLQEHSIDVVAMVHHETSTGMLNPLEEIGVLTKAHEAIFVVDCVSSVGAEIIDMEKCHIAFCTGSSSKAIASYSGLSFIIGNTREFENIKDLPVTSNYLDLYQFYYFLKTFSQTPNTPAINLCYAIDQALSNILQEGPANRHSDLRLKANVLRQGMLNQGLKFVIDQKDMCSVLTTVYIPSHCEVGLLRQKLRDKSIIIYDGKGFYKNRVFQVGNIGELSMADIQYFLKCLAEILKSFEMNSENNVISNRNDSISIHFGDENIIPIASAIIDRQ